MCTLSVELFPAIAPIGSGGASQQEDHIHHPPHPHCPQGEQLGHTQAGVAQAEAVHSQDPQEHRVEEDAGEVVPIVPVSRRFIKQIIDMFILQPSLSTAAR